MKRVSILISTIVTVLFLTISLVALGSDRISIKTIIDEISTTATSSAFQAAGSKKTFQFVGATATGAGSSTARVQVSNDAENWITMDTLSLTLSASSSSDSYYLDAPWKYFRGIVHSITGTGATVSLYAGEESRF